jgi:hypothetical protein
MMEIVDEIFRHRHHHRRCPYPPRLTDLAGDGVVEDVVGCEAVKEGVVPAPAQEPGQLLVEEL